MAWTPPSLPKSIVLMSGWGSAPKLTAEILPGDKFKVAFVFNCVFPGGTTFGLMHDVTDACGIPDGETFVLTGGYQNDHVTRWEDSFWCSTIILQIMVNDYHQKDNHDYKSLNPQPCVQPQRIAGTMSTVLSRSFPNCQRKDLYMLVLFFLTPG